MAGKVSQASRVAQVPGALLASPVPKPQETRWAGCEKTKEKGGGGLCFLSKMVESGVVEGERLAVCIEHGHAGRRVMQGARPTDAPERQV